MIKEIALSLGVLGVGVRAPSALISPNAPLDWSVAWARTFPESENWPSTNRTVGFVSRFSSGSTGGWASVETTSYDFAPSSVTPSIPVAPAFEEDEYFDFYCLTRFIEMSSSGPASVYFSFAVVANTSIVRPLDLVVTFPALPEGVFSNGVWFGTYQFTFGKPYGVNPVVPIYDYPASLSSTNWISGRSFSVPTGGITSTGSVGDSVYILSLPTVGINFTSNKYDPVWWGDISFSMRWQSPPADNSGSYWDMGYNAGFDAGFTAGSSSSTELVNPIGWLTGVFDAVGNVASLQVFPGVSLGTLLLLPVAGGLLVWLIGLLRGS